MENFVLYFLSCDIYDIDNHFCSSSQILFLAGLLVCFIEHSSSVTAGSQDQEQPLLPDVRQLLYAPMSVFGSETVVAPPAGVSAPIVANPCQSMDAQYPQQPCSPAQERPNPDYLPVATSAPYQPQIVQTLPQIMQASVLPPMPAVYMDYNRYPYVNNKQLAGGIYLL